MPTINSDTTLTLDGTTPVVVNGVQEYEWNDQWVDGFFFWTGSPGPVLTVNLTGDWNASVLRASGELGLVVNDSGTGTRHLDAILARSDADDVITLTRTQAEIIQTQGGDDRVTIGGNNWVGFLHTGEGNDRVSINSRSWLGTIDLGHGNNRLDVTDRGAGVEMIIGRNGRDVLNVMSEANMIRTHDGNDVITTGSRWVQSIDAGDGNDRITIRGEAMLVNGGRGNDVITTGAGWIGTVDAGRGGDRVVLGRGENAAVNLGRDADTLIVRPQADPRSEIYVNGGGSVSTAGDRDVDTVSFAALGRGVRVDLDARTADSAQARLTLREIENVVGTSKADVLSGNYDDNRLTGGGGRDRIEGGEGADTLIGGAAADLFIFREFDNRADRIGDFRRAQNDRIDLRGIDADTSLRGDQAFDFIGARRFSGDEGELRFVRGSNQTRIEGDVDGDGRAELVIILSQSMAMQESDFLL